MVKSVVASLGLFATSVSALGSAVVVNQCPYSVYLCDVPASGGGFQESDRTLQSGGSWTQQWTELTNLGGWSIKLSRDTSLSNIMQYEYTYQTATPDIIWYDLSDVNGNPWDGDWEVSADSGNCNPKDQAYRFATDDAYGMQSCPSDATITVTLCSGSNSGSGSSGSASSSSPQAATTVAVPSYSAPAAKPITEAAATTQTTQAQTTQESTTQVSTTQAPAPTEEPAPIEAPASTQQPATTAAAPVFSGPWTNWGLGANGAVVAEDENSPAAADNAVEHAVKAPSHTTLVTEVAGATVVKVDTAIVTEIVTATAGRLARRHEHGIQKHRHHHNA